MKKISFLSLILFFFLLLSCNDDGNKYKEIAEPEIVFQVNTQKILFKTTWASQKPVEIIAPSEWEIVLENQNWCTVSDLKGISNKEVVVKVLANKTPENRSTKVIVKTKDNKYTSTFIVSQLSEEGLSLRQQDSLNLIALYDATNGDYWTNNKGWKKGPLEEWHGLNTSLGEIGDIDDADVGRVLQLQLNYNNLSGTIPDELYGLTALRDLVINGNDLVGQISPKINQLSKLEFLNMHSNRLSGEIPAEIGDLSNLRMIYLSYNQLSKLPETISKISTLEYLYLNDNQFSGTIPNTIFGAEFLQIVNLSHNNFSGSIPASLGDIPYLFQLYLQNNQLTGSIPASFGNLADNDLKIEKLNFSNNSLGGTIPQSIIDLLPGAVFYPQRGTSFSNYSDGKSSPYAYLLGESIWRSATIVGGEYERTVTLEMHQTNPNTILIKNIPYFTGPIVMNMSTEGDTHIAKINLPQTGGFVDGNEARYLYAYMDLEINTPIYNNDTITGTLTAQTKIGQSQLVFSGGGISPSSYTEPENGRWYGCLIGISTWPNSLSIRKPAAVTKSLASKSTMSFPTEMIVDRRLDARQDRSSSKLNRIQRIGKYPILQ